jgi:nitrous oxide reductase accessory protein NosL
VLFKDGYADHFDGAKDMFKYLLDMEKYAAGRKAEDILLIGVTDYYATARIDAKKALYVIGSDVLGPMGHDLIPHPDAYDADEFAKDHQGKRIMTFDEVTMELLLALDKGEFLRK